MPATLASPPPLFSAVVAIRVVLAEDSYLVREGIRRVLDLTPDVELVAMCTELDELLARVSEERPDVVVTDIRMPPTHTDEGIRAAEQIRELSPQTGVVVLSQFAEPEYALALLARGSEGRAYLLKERVAEADQLVSAVRAVAEHGSVIDPKVVEALVAARAQARSSLLAELTQRERQVLGEMAQAKSNAAIAGALFLTERAVEKHINAIFSKLGLTEETDLNRRVKAVLVFISEGG
jgi:DNA-binding NarL/FixJ family response regulator